MNKVKMYMKYLNLSVISFVLCLMFVSIVSAQTENLIVCYAKQAFLVNGETVNSLSKCDKKNWIAPLQIESGEVPKQTKQTRRERQIFKLLRIVADNAKETNISETNLGIFLKEGKREVAAKIYLNLLPEAMKKLLAKKEMMEFIITKGTLFTDPYEYKEIERFTIKVAGSNPKIGDILEEVKKELRKDPRRKNFDIYLRKYGTWEPLDEEKTIADYGINNQDLLAMFSNVR